MKIKTLTRKNLKYFYIVKKFKKDYAYCFPEIVNEKDAEIVITKTGVSIGYNDGSCTVTNIIPCSIFPGKKLSEKQLIKLLNSCIIYRKLYF